jgi:hypothetical protein
LLGTERSIGNGIVVCLWNRRVLNTIRSNLSILEVRKLSPREEECFTQNHMVKVTARTGSQVSWLFVQARRMRKRGFGCEVGTLSRIPYLPAGIQSFISYQGPFVPLGVGFSPLFPPLK